MAWKGSGAMKKALIVMILAATVTGCASYNISSENYGLGTQTMKYFETRMGSVIDVREVNASAPGTTGAGTGAVLGGVAGKLAGGNAAAMLGGAALGAGAGYLAEKGIFDEKALEITVKTDGGETFTVIQGKDFYPAVGQRVKILRDGRQIRIRPVIDDGMAGVR